MPDLMDGPGRWDSIQLLDRAQQVTRTAWAGYSRSTAATCTCWPAQLDARLRSRVNPSDLVQETFLRASRHFGEFCGSSEQEWLGWLRTILRRSVLKMVHRQVVAHKRSVLREISLQDLGARCGPEASGSASLVESPGSSPSSHAQREELSSAAGRAPVQAAGALPRSPGAAASGRAQLSGGCRPHGTPARSRPNSLVAAHRASAATAHDRGVAMKPDSARASLLADLPDEQEAEVLGILEEYLAELECGGRPSPEDWIARHPDLEDILSAYLRELDQLHHAGLPRSFPAGENPAARVNGERGRLGDFQIIREIGRGGMGVVYEAQQLSLDRKVALKVLPFAATLDSRQLKRFKNEAQAAAQLHHNQIVPVYAVGCDRGVHYYAMQFIDGQSLAEIIQELRELSPLHPGQQREARSDGAGPAGADGNLTILNDPTVEARTGIVTPRFSVLGPQSSTFFRAAAELIVQAALALEHAHQLGVVHRDIKPANLLVDASGNLWITDFGLARGRTEQGLTRSEDLVGTLRYMSPEQALAKHGLVDHRTDIYSLGVTLYELLTLEPAYAGSDRDDLLRQIAMGAPRLPRQLRPEIPVALETIVLKAVAHEPERRYVSAEDLAEDLQRFLENRPIRAVRPTLWERLAKWCGRHKPVLVGGAVLVTLGAVALIACTILIWRRRKRPRRAQRKQKSREDEPKRILARHFLGRGS